MEIICKNCSLSSDFEDKSYQDEIWCEFHQQPKFNDNCCETFIEKGKEATDETKNEATT